VKGVIYGRYLWMLSVAVIYGCYLVVERLVNYILDLVPVRRTLNTSVPSLRICGIGLHNDVCVRCLVTISSFGL
jgi:hypothetical protein